MSPTAGGLPALLRRAAQRYPEREAVVHGRTRIRYAELWRQVHGCARDLRAQGVTRGQRVALLQENSIGYIVAYYGIQLAGGVVAALSPQAKARELASAINHAQAEWLIADAGHPELKGLCRSCSFRLLETQSLLARVAGADAPDEGAVAAEPGSDELAAIVYTSGTTGRPKGVMLSHGNLVSNVRAISAYLALSAEDKLLNVLPFTYAYGNSVLHTHLAAGACLVLENSLMYPARVVERMAEEGVTGFAGVAATYALLLNRTRLQDYALHRLRYLTQAGGAMPPAQINRVRQLLPQADFYVMYGQTEATARLCYLPPNRLSEKLGSVGIPVNGVELSIRGADGEPLPAGASGEVWARGTNIMLGYWNDPEMSARVLVDGWLRTGDIGRLDDEGFLYLEGRAVEMIKTGAHRVAPQEIEEVIAELPEVAEVAVIGVADALMGQLIKAVVVPAPGVELDPRLVRAQCGRHLAAYKVPKFVEVTSDLPRTGSGKIKRSLLQAGATE